MFHPHLPTAHHQFGGTNHSWTNKHRGLYDFNLPTTQQQVKVETTSSVSSKSDTSVVCKPTEGENSTATEKSAFGEMATCENGQASQQLTSEQQQMTFHFPTPPNEDGEVSASTAPVHTQEKATKPASNGDQPNIILNSASITSYSDQETGLAGSNKLVTYPATGGDAQNKISSTLSGGAYSSAMHQSASYTQQPDNSLVKYASSTNSLSTSHANQYSNSTLAKKKSRTNACELQVEMMNWNIYVVDSSLFIKFMTLV